LGNGCVIAAYATSKNDNPEVNFAPAAIRLKSCALPIESHGVTIIRDMNNLFSAGTKKKRTMNKTIGVRSHGCVIIISR